MAGKKEKETKCKWNIFGVFFFLAVFFVVVDWVAVWSLSYQVSVRPSTPSISLHSSSWVLRSTLEDLFYHSQLLKAHLQIYLKNENDFGDILKFISFQGAKFPAEAMLITCSDKRVWSVVKQRNKTTSYYAYPGNHLVHKLEYRTKTLEILDNRCFNATFSCDSFEIGRNQRPEALLWSQDFYFPGTSILAKAASQKIYLGKQENKFTVYPEEPYSTNDISCIASSALLLDEDLSKTLAKSLELEEQLFLMNSDGQLLMKTSGSVLSEKLIEKAVSSVKSKMKEIQANQNHISFLPPLTVEGSVYIPIIEKIVEKVNWLLGICIPEDSVHPELKILRYAYFLGSLLALSVVALTICAARCLKSSLQQLLETMNKESSNQLKKGTWRLSEFEELESTIVAMKESMAHYSSNLDSIVQSRTKELAKARDLADIANLAKSHFLASMSHEIRTPMYGVISLTGFLLESNLSEEQRGWCKDIQSSCMSLMKVLNDILDLSKVEAGRMILDFVDMDLMELIEEVMNVYHHIIIEQNKPLDIILDWEEHLPRKLVGDPTRIRQILSNLVSNAVKFTDSGVVILKVKRFHASPPESYHPQLNEASTSIIGIQMEIRDTGIGMTSQQIGKLFEEYSQGSSQYQGTGLGLSIVKNMIRLFGGEIVVESSKGKGSIFRFHLFLGRSSSGETVEEGEVITLPKDGLIITPKVELFVALSTALKRVLPRWKHCKSISRAMNILRRNSSNYSVVVVDEPFFSAKGELHTFMPRVILICSRAGNGYIEREAIGYFCKPIKPSTCLAIWNDMMKPNKLKKKQLEQTPKHQFQLHILLVEDNIINQKVAALTLQKLGCTVTVASNGLDAIQKFKSSLNGSGKSYFDLIFMDILMPQMDGRTAAKEIREIEKNLSSRIPIIALTASAMIEERDKCMEVDMDHYLSKPLDYQLLLEYLEHYSKIKQLHSLT